MQRNKLKSYCVYALYICDFIYNVANINIFVVIKAFINYCNLNHNFSRSYVRLQNVIQTVFIKFRN